MRRIVITAAVLSLIALAMAWTFGPLANRFDPTWLSVQAARLKDGPFAPVAIATIFLVACVMGAPATLLIGTMVLLFGPLRGACCAYANLLLSGSVVYAIVRHARARPSMTGLLPGPMRDGLR